VQAREVVKVKRSANGIIPDPHVLAPDDSVAHARQLMAKFAVTKGRDAGWVGIESGLGRTVVTLPRRSTAK